MESLPEQDLQLNKLTSMRKAGELEVKAMIDDDHMLKITVEAKDKENKDACPPVDLVAILDISGSMGNSAAGRNDGSTEYIDLGYSLLDLLKHATRTIISTMRP